MVDSFAKYAKVARSLRQTERVVGRAGKKHQCRPRTESRSGDSSAKHAVVAGSLCTPNTRRVIFGGAEENGAESCRSSSLRTILQWPTHLGSLLGQTAESRVVDSVTGGAENCRSEPPCSVLQRTIHLGVKLDITSHWEKQRRRSECNHVRFRC